MDITVLHTLEFILQFTPKRADILEIGCGAGEVALAMTKKGYSVTAIDSDANAVAVARANGVAAELANWPAYKNSKYDAIAFTRSLHHIHDLNAAIAGAYERLTAGGLLLIEDFAFEETDQKTISWFANSIRELESMIPVPFVADSFVAKLNAAPSPHQAWRDDHGHELHSIGAMTDAVTRVFEESRGLATPYLFRYVASALINSPRDCGRLTSQFFDAERYAISSRQITPVGRRIVAKKAR